MNPKLHWSLKRSLGLMSASFMVLANYLNVAVAANMAATQAAANAPTDSVPAPTPQAGSECPTLALRGASAWQAAKSGPYDYCFADLKDSTQDVKDCSTQEAANGGIDLLSVRASVWHKQEGWRPAITISMSPEAGDVLAIAFTIEIQNSLGTMTMENNFHQLDLSGFPSPAPTLATYSSATEYGIDMDFPLNYEAANEAAEALASWFDNLTLTIRAETASGSACDRVAVPGAILIPANLVPQEPTKFGGNTYIFNVPPSVKQGSTLTFTIHGTDPDGNPLGPKDCLAMTANFGPDNPLVSTGTCFEPDGDAIGSIPIDPAIYLDVGQYSLFAGKKGQQQAHAAHFIVEEGEGESVTIYPYCHRFGLPALSSGPSC